MAFTQVIAPDPKVPCTPGWCLTYVDNAFNLAAHGKTKNYPTALSAWNASNSRHVDRNFPANCWVLVWFTLKSNPAGHVAILAPDGAVWSSSHPTDKKPVRHESLEAIIKYYGPLGLSYLGWTEDVGGVIVIKEGEDMIQSNEHLNILFQSMFDRNATEEEHKEWVGKKTYSELIDVLKTQPAYADTQRKQTVGSVALRDDWEGQIATLLKQIRVLPADTSDAEKKLQAIKDALGIK